MTEEEYFRKNYPNSCYGDKPLSPHWDFFQDGVEFGERQSEKRIAELEKENAELKELIKSEHEIEARKNNSLVSRITKAKEIIKTFLGFAEAFGYSPSMDKFITDTRQFLNSEVTK